MYHDDPVFSRVSPFLNAVLERRIINGLLQRAVVGYTAIPNNFVRAHYTVNICRQYHDTANIIDKKMMRTNIDQK
jgi:hypothetical protein